MIASRFRAAYLAHMFATRIAAILAMLALLFGPVSMIGGYVAMAQPSASASHHEQSPGQSAPCTEMSGETQDRSSDPSLVDCLTDCAITCSAIPAFSNAIAHPVLVPRIAHALPLASPLRGVPPEASDPPPRPA